MFLFGPTTVLHLNHQVCTKSRRSLQLTHKILTWCQPRLALLRAAHISGACNQSGKGRCTFQGLITSRGMEASPRGSTGDLALVLEGQRWIFLLQRRPSFASNGSQRQKCPVPWARVHCLTNSRAAYFMCFLQSLCYGRLYIGPLCASTECYLWHHNGQPTFVTETSDRQSVAASPQEGPPLPAGAQHLAPRSSLFAALGVAVGINPYLEHCDPAVIHTISNARGFFHMADLCFMLEAFLCMVWGAYA